MDFGSSWQSFFCRLHFVALGNFSFFTRPLFLDVETTVNSPETLVLDMWILRPYGICLCHFKRDGTGLANSPGAKFRRGGCSHSG